MTNKVPDRDQIVRSAEKIMSADREILRALATTELDEQMAVARDVMKRRQTALDKLAK